MTEKLPGLIFSFAVCWEITFWNKWITEKKRLQVGDKLLSQSLFQLHLL